MARKQFLQYISQASWWQAYFVAGLLGCQVLPKSALLLIAASTCMHACMRACVHVAWVLPSERNRWCQHPDRAPRVGWWLMLQSRNTRNRIDAAKELKKLVFFSNIVVAPLVEGLKVGCLKWGGMGAGGVVWGGGYVLVWYYSFPTSLWHLGPGGVVWMVGLGGPAIAGSRTCRSTGTRHIQHLGPTTRHPTNLYMLTPAPDRLQSEEEKKKEAEEAEQQKQIMELMQKAREEASKKEAEEKEGKAPEAAAEGSTGAGACAQFVLPWLLDGWQMSLMPWC